MQLVCCLAVPSVHSCMGSVYFAGLLQSLALFIVACSAFTLPFLLRAASVTVASFVVLCVCGRLAAGQAAEGRTSSRAAAMLWLAIHLLSLRSLGCEYFDIRYSAERNASSPRTRRHSSFKTPLGYREGILASLKIIDSVACWLLASRWRMAPLFRGGLAGTSAFDGIVLYQSGHGSGHHHL